MLKEQIEKILFYSILLFLPTQLGRHFWPDFSFIQGLRIDYLSPTIYLTDILILLLFGFCFFGFYSSKSFFNIKYQISNIKYTVINNFLLGLFFVTILIGILFSKSPMAGFYGLVKFFEFLFLGYYTAKNIKDFKIIAGLFSIGVLFGGGLAILQFINHGSLGSLMYFFGERAYNATTPGIANVSLGGELILRPYATFPHPNVLASYLVIAMTIIIFNFQLSTLNFKKVLYIFSFIIGTTALLLTMSRVVILLWFVILMIFLAKTVNDKNKFFAFCFLLFAFCFLFLSPLGSRFFETSFNDQSFVIRKDLIASSFLMFKDNFFFGVGLNNFLPNLPHYQNQNMNSFFEYLQPVHNIYLLILTQVGVLGFIYFIWFLTKIKSKIKNQTLPAGRQESKIKDLLATLLLIVLILGLFDHYFLTIQQGQLLFSLVLGFCWGTFSSEIS